MKLLHFIRCFRKYQRGKRVRKIGTLWALTFVEIVEEKIDYLDIVFLPKSQRGCDEIVPEVTKRLAPGAIMRTDCWKAYPEAARQAQAVHYTVNHSKQFKTAEGIHTNSVEGELGKSNLGVLKYF